MRFGFWEVFFVFVLGFALGCITTVEMHWIDKPCKLNRVPCE